MSGSFTPEPVAASTHSAALGGAGANDPHARHFATDHLMGDLKGRSVRGGAVTLSAQGVKFVLQLGSTAVLARLLTPADFGLIAMVTAITGFVAMFKDAGLSMATVQRAEVNHAQVSTLFWINVALSVVVMLVVAALSPLIAAFYSEPRLVWITLALAATMVFGGLTVQHQALLKRQMRFKALAAIEISSMAGGIAVAIVMAWQGFGYWSLVGNFASMAAINAALVWILSGWRPGLPRQSAESMSMLRFGGSLTGFSVLNYITRNIDNVTVGAVLGATTLGIYNKAYGLLLLPVKQVNAPVNSVAIPTLSRLQSQPTKFRKYYLAAISAVASMTFPIVVFAASDTRNLILTILGPQWIDSVPVFQWLAIAAFVGGINIAPGWLCIALGNLRRQLYWAMLCAPAIGLAVLFSVQFGAVAVAASFSITWSVLFMVFVPWACRGTPVSWVDVVRAILPPAMCCIVGAVAVMVVKQFSMGWSAPVALCANGVVFGCVYSTCWFILVDWKSLWGAIGSSFRFGGKG